MPCLCGETGWQKIYQATSEQEIFMFYQQKVTLGIRTLFSGKTISLWTAGAILSLFMIGAAFGDEYEIQRYEKIDVEANIVGVLQGSPGFADTDGTVGTTMVFDFGLTIQPSRSGTAYMQVKSGYGVGIDENIPTLSMFNHAIAGSHHAIVGSDLSMIARSSLSITEAWYEHAFGERVRLRGGKIDIATDFDTNAVANDEYGRFLSSAFVHNLALGLPDDNGFGAMLWISPNTFFDIGVGFADAAADWDNVFKNPFSILEFGLKPEIAGRQGNYRFYGWHNGGDHERLISPEITDDANYGFGLSADQEITENVILFARYGRQRGSVSQIEHAWSAGFSISGKFLRREGDILGLAYGQAVIGNDWKSLDPENGMDSGNEHRLEIYYNIRANSYLNISPNMQWVKNPGGDRGSGGVWALGVRAHFNLRNLNRGLNLF
jgi:hypothetical protein